MGIAATTFTTVSHPAVPARIEWSAPRLGLVWPKWFQHPLQHPLSLIARVAELLGLIPWQELSGSVELIFLFYAGLLNSTYQPRLTDLPNRVASWLRTRLPAILLLRYLLRFVGDVESAVPCCPSLVHVFPAPAVPCNRLFLQNCLGKTAVPHVFCDTHRESRRGIESSPFYGQNSTFPMP